MPRKSQKDKEVIVDSNSEISENLDTLSMAQEEQEIVELDNKKKKKRKEKSEEFVEENLETSIEDMNRVEEANKEVKAANSKTKKVLKALFFVFNLCVVVGILVWNLKSSEDFISLFSLNINYAYLLVVVLFIAIFVFLDILPVQYLINKVSKRKRWALSFKSTAMLRYYDAITPLATGGQPFMIVYLISRDIPATTAVSIPISKLIAQQVDWIILSFICLVVALTRSSSSFVGIAGIIGFILACIVCFSTLFLSLSKRANKIMDWGLRLLHKMKIVKNYEKAQTKMTGFINNYQNIMKQYRKSKLDLFVMFFSHMARYVILYSIPFFIYCAFVRYDPVVYSELFMFSVVIELASSFIPLPGGTGMSEISITYIFSKYFGGATFWALILWRAINYYYNLIQGIFVIIYDTFYGNKKYKWVQKSRALQAESQIFKQNEIEKFRNDRNKRRKRNAK